MAFHGMNYLRQLENQLRQVLLQKLQKNIWLIILDHFLMTWPI